MELLGQDETFKKLLSGHDILYVHLLQHIH